MSLTPKVSFLITVLNGEQHIRPTLCSILNQDYKSIDVVVIDDGSTDNTVSIIKSLQENNKQIKLFTPGRLGRGRALNFGLKQCSGNYIAINDADDISKPNRISKQLEYMFIHPECGMLGSNFDIAIEKTGEIKHCSNPLSDNDIRKTLTQQQALQHSTVMFRKEVLEQVGGYSEKIPFLLDREIFIRVAQVTKAANLADRLVIINRHRNQFFNHGFKGFHRNWMHMRMCLKAIQAFGFPKYQLIRPIATFLRNTAAVLFYSFTHKIGIKNG